MMQGWLRRGTSVRLTTIHLIIVKCRFTSTLCLARMLGVKKSNTLGDVNELRLQRRDITVALFICQTSLLSVKVAYKVFVHECKFVPSWEFISSYPCFLHSILLH